MAIRQILDRVLTRVENLCLWGAVIALVLTGLLVLLAVPARSMPGLIIPDSSQIARFLLLTSIALGLGQVTGVGHHIAVDLLYVNLSPRVKLFARYLAIVAGLVFFVPLAWWYAGLTIEMFEKGRTLPGLLRLPRWPLYLMMGLGFILVSVRLSLQLVMGAPDLEAKGH